MMALPSSSARTFFIWLRKSARTFSSLKTDERLSWAPSGRSRVSSPLTQATPTWKTFFSKLPKTIDLRACLSRVPLLQEPPGEARSATQAAQVPDRRHCWGALFLLLLFQVAFWGARPERGNGLESLPRKRV